MPTTQRTRKAKPPKVVLKTPPKRPAPEVPPATAHQPHTVEPEHQPSPAEGTATDYVQWKWRSQCAQYGVLRIATGGVVIDYIVERCSPFTFRLRYADGPGSWTEYGVQLGQAPRCGCASYRVDNSRGEAGATCKHIRALAAFRDRKEI